MEAFIQKSLLQLTQLREILYAIYFIGVLVLAFAMIIEVKLYFDLDVFPGMDFPIDEWYASAFGR